MGLGETHWLSWGHTARQGRGRTQLALHPWTTMIFQLLLLLIAPIHQGAIGTHRSFLNFYSWHHWTLLQMWDKSMHTFSLIVLVSKVQNQVCIEQGASFSFWLLSDTVPQLVVSHSCMLPQIHWLCYFRQNVLYLPLLMIRLWCKCERNVQVWILRPRCLVALFLKRWKTFRRNF